MFILCDASEQRPSHQTVILIGPTLSEVGPT